MKGLATKFAVLTAATVISALPVLAGEMGTGMNPGSVQKDQCLLVSQTCRNSVDSIQQRIDRLGREIGRGSSVYSNEELRQLEFQLRDAIQTLESLNRPGA
ncbi:MAG TPA: hypothetical protein DCZ75_05970 [Geobacter sp.]|nr:hypothetical protein [Geobacter sp.]